MRHGSELKIDGSRLDFLKELIPYYITTPQNIVSLEVKNSFFTNNINFISYLESNALSKFEVLSNTFTSSVTSWPTTSDSTNWIFIKNHSGSILVDNNDTYYYARGLYADNIGAVTFSNNNMWDCARPFATFGTIATISDNKFYDYYRTPINDESHVSLVRNEFHHQNPVLPNY